MAIAVREQLIHRVSMASKGLMEQLAALRYTLMVGQQIQTSILYLHFRISAECSLISLIDIISLTT